MPKSESKNSPRNKLQWSDLKPFSEGENPKLKVKKQALNKRLDTVFGHLKSDFYDKTAIQCTLDNNYIYVADILNNVARRCYEPPLARERDKLVSHPKKGKGIEYKKGCPKKKLQPARKVLENGKCKFCGSKQVVKWGKQNGHQRYKCKECSHVFDDNQQFPRMRENYKIIATALDLYYEGLSLRKTSRQIKKLFGKRVSQVTIWNWIQKYTTLVKQFTQSLTPRTKKGIWHIDETSIKMKGKKGLAMWYWDCIDHDSRFIVGTHMSEMRYVQDAQEIFTDARNQTEIRPSTVVCDSLYAYRKGFIRAYSWSDFSKINFNNKAGVSKEKPYNNNRIERYHNTIKARTKIMRGMQNPRAILDGFTIHYNFIRRHQTLGTTPARIAGIDLPFEDGWGDLIQFATINRNI